MEIAGNEYAFNDPYDPHIDFENGEQNDLNQSIYTQFNGKGMGFKVGNFFQPNKNFAIGAVLEIIPPMNFNGDMKVEQNMMPALNANALTGEADEDEEIIDPAKLDLAKLTLTTPYENPIDDKCEVNFSIFFYIRYGLQIRFFKNNIWRTDKRVIYKLPLTNINFNYFLAYTDNFTYIFNRWDRKIIV